MNPPIEVPPSVSAEAHWQGIPLSRLHQLAQAHGTPYFLYNVDTVAQRVRMVRAAFNGNVRVLFAVKANPNLEVLRSIRGTVDGLDVSSGGELVQAGLAGFEMGRLSFAGPAKTSAELESAIRAGVGCISVESPRELQECIDIASHSERPAHVTLRVNPRLLTRAYGLKMGGRAVQFGIDEEELGSVLRMIVDAGPTIAFEGIHVYAGSQGFDVEGVAEGIKDTLRIARDVEARSGLACRTINLGGGFGVAHSTAGNDLDVAALATAVLPLLPERSASGDAPPVCMLELGRFLVARAGLYVTRTVSEKSSRGKTYCIVDGGLHHHLTAAGTFGTALRANFSVQNLSRPDAELVKCDIAGPSCNPTDLLGIDVALPRPERGDLVGILNSGSYGLTASPVLFLGRPTPVELVHSDGRISVGRRSRTIEDFN